MKLKEHTPNRQKQILRLLIERDGFVCGICFKEITNVFEADVDHIIPSDLGGEDISTNLQPAHMKCNQDKSNRLIGNLEPRPACEKVDKLLSMKREFIDRIKENPEFQEKQRRKHLEKQKDKAIAEISASIEAKKHKSHNAAPKPERLGEQAKPVKVDSESPP